MIRPHVEAINRDVVSKRNLAEEFCDPLTNLATQDRLAILGAPHEMVLCVVDGMRSPAKSHK